MALVGARFPSRECKKYRIKRNTVVENDLRDQANYFISQIKNAWYLIFVWMKANSGNISRICKNRVQKNYMGLNMMYIIINTWITNLISVFRLDIIMLSLLSKQGNATLNLW